MLNDGDDGVLLVRLGTVVTQMMPYGQPGKTNYKKSRGG